MSIYSNIQNKIISYSCILFKKKTKKYIYYHLSSLGVLLFITLQGKSMKKTILTLCLLMPYLFANDANTTITNQCSTCHGSKMERSAYGVSKKVNSLSKDEIISTLRAYKSGSKNSYGMGEVMKSQLNSLSDKQLTELADFIPTLR